MTITERLAALSQPAILEPRIPQSRVITVRMKRELHERLKTVAHAKRVSLNMLCVLAVEAAAEELEMGEVPA